MSVRIEQDTMGEVSIPSEMLYGAQTQRALNNFHIQDQPFPLPFIKALLTIKRAAAQTNAQLGVLAPTLAQAIIKACDTLDDDAKLLKHFPLSIYQTGSGTSTNMNANEVIATLANSFCASAIHPNDHVNLGQSSNDVIPSAIQVSTALELEHRLLPKLRAAVETIEAKASQMQGLIKTGRTHLMDAMPIAFSQVLSAWSEQLKLVGTSLKQFQPNLQSLPQGGTAVGTGVNTHPNFQTQFLKYLSEQTKLIFTKPNRGVFHLISGQETSTLLSGQLKALAVALIKIANDLRWMNSGPINGLGEISLKALQPGSSIMPGKVNPVIPEAVIMACYQVIGYDSAVTLAAQSGQFELNVSLPLIANNLLSSITLLSNSLRSLAEQAIASFTVNQEKISQGLNLNPVLITALTGRIGYEKAATIAKKAYLESRPILDVAHEATQISLEELKQLLDPQKLCNL